MTTSSSKPSPLISVIIPTFNRAHYLCLAIKSVEAQSYPNVEIIVIDDGSTDGTSEIVTQFSGNPNFHYLKQENKGVSAARNKGLAVAKGEFIAFCDSDDLWTPSKLELQAPWLIHFPTIGVVYTDATNIDAEGTSYPSTWNPPRYNGQITSQLILGNFVTGMTSLVRSSCFSQIGGYDESLRTSEDYALWLKLSKVTHFFHLPEVTYLYRQWSQQVSNPKNKKLFLNDSLSVKLAFAESNPALVSSDFIKRTIALNQTETIMLDAQSDKGRVKSVIKLLNVIRKIPDSKYTWKCLAKLVIGRHET